jgi:S1-C subfamily serine protease
MTLSHAVARLFLAFVITVPLFAAAQTAVEDRLKAVVKVKAFVPADARTAESLGRERNGAGVVIDQSGLVLTIGYLIVEADGAEITVSGGRTIPAQVIGYDHESGFGLLRALEPPRIKPAQLGRASALKERDPVLIVGAGGSDGAQPGFVVSKRVFAGSWEYMLDEAIFTAPPHPAWSGAALYDGEGKLVGIGSLVVGDASGRGAHIPGNMFVPIDLLPPILADLIAEGVPSGPRKPWLGIAADESRGRLFVNRVTPGSPAARAGISAGDLVLGVNGEPVRELRDFYRKVWGLGAAGVTVPLNVLQGMSVREIPIESADRHTHLKLKRTY